MICTLHQKLLVQSKQDDEIMAHTRHTRNNENKHKFYSRNTKGGDHFSELDTDGRIISKRTLKEQCVRVRTVPNRLSSGSKEDLVNMIMVAQNAGSLLPT
jgi:predicted AAA+ superfamily ATPase